jgi:hypothetical protein
MPGKVYNILTEDFCFYCQQQFTSADDLQHHVLKVHPGSYAAASIQRTQEKIK